MSWGFKDVQDGLGDERGIGVETPAQRAEVTRTAARVVRDAQRLAEAEREARLEGVRRHARAYLRSMGL